MKSPRGAFICAQIEGYEYTNKKGIMRVIFTSRCLPSPSSNCLFRPSRRGFYDMTPTSHWWSIPFARFLSELLPALNFGESFGFGRGFDFDGAFAARDLSFYDGYDDVSCSMSVEGYVCLSRRSRHRKAHRKIRQYHKESVLLSSWYVNFLRPWIICNLTHELTSSDRFREFWSLFWMQLSKVEELTDILINRRYRNAKIGQVPRGFPWAEWAVHHVGALLPWTL